MAIASRQNNILRIWHRPYSWLTALAIISIIFNVLIIGGFPPTVRILVDTYSSEVNRAAVVNIGVFVQLALFVLPIVMTVFGAILLFQKKRIGVYIVLAGIGIYLASSISSAPLASCCNIFVRDPVDMLVGYWYKPTFNEMHILCYSCYVAQKATFYYFFLPTMLVMIALSFIGWMRTKRLG